MQGLPPRDVGFRGRTCERNEADVCLESEKAPLQASMSAAAGAADGQSQLIVHADMYRLTGIDELAETGWDDAIAPPAWVFVEWPQRIAAALPVERIDLAIAITSPTARTLTITGYGPAHAAAVAAMQRA
jgi:hypothetical protein